MAAPLLKNIPRLLAYRFLADCLFLAPVLIPLFQSKGLSTMQIMMVESVFHVVVLCWEVPSGYFADLLGRRRSLLLGSLVLTAGFAVYACSSSFVWFCLAEFLCGVGFAFNSGADSALLYDTLKALGRQQEYQRFEGKLQAWARFGTAAGAGAGGALALLSLRLPFWVNIGSGVALLLTAFSLQEPPQERVEGKRVLREILSVVSTCLSTPALRNLMALNALLFSSGVVGVWSYFLYYSKLQLPVAVGGLVFCLFQVVSGLGGRLTNSVTSRLGVRGGLSLILVIGIGFAALGTTTSLFLLPAIFLNGLLWNALAPILYEQVNRRTESKTRATVLSVLSLGSSFSYVVLAPSFGRLADRTSLGTAYLALGATVFVLGALLCLRVR